MPEFTQDFFTRAIPNFQQVRSLTGPVDRALEIGCYQGRSACWMLENLLGPTGELICIDPFTQQDIDCFDLRAEPKGNLDIADRFWRNIRQHQRPGQRVDLLAERSYTALARLIDQRQQFDFVYIDGNHSAAAILADAGMSWGLVRSGGIMLLDDYKLDRETMRAMDHWLEAVGSLCTVIIRNDQMGLKKS